MGPTGACGPGLLRNAPVWCQNDKAGGGGGRVWVPKAAGRREPPQAATAAPPDPAGGLRYPPPRNTVPLLRGSPAAAEPKAGFCRHLAMEKRRDVATGPAGAAAPRGTRGPAARRVWERRFTGPCDPGAVWAPAGTNPGRVQPRRQPRPRGTGSEPGGTQQAGLGWTRLFPVPWKDAELSPV